MAQRIQYHRYGGPEVMVLEEFSPASPGPGQVLVRVKAAATNPMDGKIRDGLMEMMTGQVFPRGLGHDFAGVVMAVGDGVTRLAVGDEVLGGASIQASGAFAEVVLADADGVVLKPSNLPWAQAAVIPTVGLTAYQALVKVGGLTAGQSVFVHGCLGGVGRSAVQIALMLGASVAGSCRDVDSARSLGVSPIVPFDFDPAAFAGRFDVVLDTAGTLPASASVMGKCVVDIVPSAEKFQRSAVEPGYHVMIAQGDVADLSAVAQAAGDGALRLPIALTVPLGDAVAALTSHTRGKLVIAVD